MSRCCRSTYDLYFTIASTESNTEAGDPVNSKDLSTSSPSDAAFSRLSRSTVTIISSTFFSVTCGICSTSSADFLVPVFLLICEPPIRSLPPRSAHSVTFMSKDRSFCTLSSIRYSLASTAASRSSSMTRPNSFPFCVNRRSALSARREIRYSARDVNIRYGSEVPLVTKSSTNTPMYPSSLPTIKGFGVDNPAEIAEAVRPALAPATMPWAAASSYPVVPQICPARYKPLIFFVSKVCVSDIGLTKSYSTS
mmetsp:Transcript_21826/g.54095  ORF Transcript_21826/g.54095 Transcript_21826/m.54095 type:complete len:252 (+) Transcript_21826:274-1029(+)